ncbi:MAG: sugar phosphate isomerase/epimerase [Clostridia bacterium]|nr:sugar phosphate isomerase/epimerase [Clostridia bacterium]
MKFGHCSQIATAQHYFPSAADFIEVNAMETQRMDATALKNAQRILKDKGLQPYSCSCLFAPTMRLTGEGVDFQNIREYCDSLFDSLAQLGVQVIVFGSGKAKHVPEGFSKQRAMEQLYELGAILADEAAKRQQTIAVEALSYNEVNILNTIKETAAYVRTVHRDNYKLMVDIFHHDNNQEPFSDLTDAKDLLVHAHFCAPKTRGVLQTEQDWQFLDTYLRFLQSIGYTGNFSFEGECNSNADLSNMFAHIKKIYP